MNSAYVHIPFCLSRCSYCDFAICVDPRGRERERYLQALALDMDSQCREFDAPIVLQTLYIGGGTPSLLTIAELSDLFVLLGRYFRLAAGAEVTLESNPRTLSREKLVLLRELGVNRLSIGVQSFQDQTLRTLGRGHSAHDAKQTVELVRLAGFENISLDLIYGIPGQNLSDWASSLQQALALGVEHLSCYALSIEEHTHLGRLQATGKLQSSDDEQYAQYYELLCELLGGAGFEHYEVSNFARSSRYRSEHNLVYWRNGDYWAFGLGAHGHHRPRRYRHHTDWQSYLTRPDQLIDIECNLATEDFMLACRLAEGVDLKRWQAQYGINLLDDKQSQLRQLQEAGLLCYAPQTGRLSFTESGLFVSNAIIATLLY